MSQEEVTVDTVIRLKNRGNYSGCGVVLNPNGCELSIKTPDMPEVRGSYIRDTHIMFYKQRLTQRVDIFENAKQLNPLKNNP